MRTDLESLKGLQEVLKVLSELHKSSNYFNFWTNRCWWGMLAQNCWGRNFLVTTLRFWWWFWSFTIFLHERRAPTFKRCHQDRNSASNIQKMSQISSHQNHDVTNMTVTPISVSHAIKWVRRFLEKYDQIVYSYFYQSMISDERWVMRVGHGIVTVDPKVYWEI